MQLCNSHYAVGTHPEIKQGPTVRLFHVHGNKTWEKNSHRCRKRKPFLRQRFSCFLNESPSLSLCPMSRPENLLSRILWTQTLASGHAANVNLRRARWRLGRVKGHGGQRCGEDELTFLSGTFWSVGHRNSKGQINRVVLFLAAIMNELPPSSSSPHPRAPPLYSSPWLS